MLNFVAKHFRTLIGIGLWLNLVFCAIAGANVGNTFDKGEGGTIGFIFGIIAGLLLNIICGGLVATFLSIDKGVKNINKWLQVIWQNSNNIKPDAKTTFISDDDIYYFDS